MNGQQIAEVVLELQPLIGGRIQKIDRTGDRTIVVSIRVPKRTVLLLVSGDHRRVHLIDHKPPRTVPGGSVQRTLRQRLEGKPLLALEADGSVVEIESLDARLSVDISKKKNPFRWRPPSGRALPDPSRLPTIPDRFELSSSLANEYEQLGPGEAENALKTHLSQQISKKRKKLARRVAKLEADGDRLAKMVAGAHLGELLKSVLGKVERGSGAVEAFDWRANAVIRVPLDPSLDAKRNMERYFNRAKKGARGTPIVERRLKKTRAQIAALDAELARIQSAEGDELGRLADRTEDDGRILTEQRVPKKQNRLDAWSRAFVASDGSVIRVGKGARENDRLTLNGARGHDTWLHARGTAGAHVVLFVEKGKSPNPEALIDAAHLAAHHSSAKNDTKVEVIVTEARNVKKLKGDPPGRVSVAKSRTILVAMDVARLDRLLGRDR